ncbi:hypothetical protein [Bradyrhizobium lablabi]|uniref:hypothetical protein n=1 Tax=Bradyrhizobium lablabi TaxID=722472 RepID=UPI0018D2AD0C|nr:hypothetical protein [Bradyrhizobium lablabi]
MLTEFFRPSGLTTKRITETTFVVEKKVTEKASLLVEYVGDYPVNASPSHLLNSGGLYHLSPTQQVDFHVAFGLNHNAHCVCRKLDSAILMVKAAKDRS